MTALLFCRKTLQNTEKHWNIAMEKAIEIKQPEMERSKRN